MIWRKKVPKCLLYMEVKDNQFDLTVEELLYIEYKDIFQVEVTENSLGFWILSGMDPLEPIEWVFKVGSINTSPTESVMFVRTPHTAQCCPVKYHTNKQQKRDMTHVSDSTSTDNILKYFV